MIMIAATGVKTGIAKGATMVALQVFSYGHFVVTGSAKHGLCTKFICRPGCCRVMGSFVVAINAGIIFVAAFHAYGNNIPYRVIMSTSCMFICYVAFNGYV